MKSQSGSALIALGFILAGSAPAQSAQPSAEDFPNKPIRWIVPFSAGGSNDVLARYIGAKLGERLGEQVVIDNRGGANGIIGADLAAHCAARRLHAAHGVDFVRHERRDSHAALRRRKIVRSRCEHRLVAELHRRVSGLRHRLVAELIERAQAKPGSLNYASTGVGGFNHFGGELFKKVANVNLVHVPYRGGGPAMIDVMSGQVPIMFSSLTQVLPNVRNGQLKLIAVGAPKRSPVVPDTPTIAESGYPEYDVSVWWGVSSPAGAPRPLLAKLRQEITAVLEQLRDPHAPRGGCRRAGHHGARRHSPDDSRGSGEMARRRAACGHPRRWAEYGCEMTNEQPESQHTQRTTTARTARAQ